MAKRRARVAPSGARPSAGKTVKREIDPTIQKAIEELDRSKNRQLPALEWNEGLNLAAKDHCDDLGPQGLRGQVIDL